MMNSKGFITTTIITIILLFVLAIFSLNISKYLEENKLINEIITSKDLVYDRTNFEYNFYNNLKQYLDLKVKTNQNIEELKPNIDLYTNNILNDFNFPLILSTETNLLVEIIPCGELDCIYYKYSIINKKSKTIIKNNKSISIEIPKNFSIENVVII